MDLFKHKMGGWQGLTPPYVSPYLLEVLSTRSGAPGWASATGSLVANTGQVITCTRASSAYCLGDDGLLHLLGVNTPRVEPLGLLVEAEGTNSMTRSNEFSNGVSWTTEQATWAQNATGPDGVVNGAWTWTAAAGAAVVHRTYQNGATGMNSIYAKAGTLQFVGLWPGGILQGAVFDLSNGTIPIDHTAGASATIEDMGNGWFRCSAYFVGYFIFGAGPTAADCDGDQPWAAAGTETMHFWQADSVNLPFPTSPIPAGATAGVRKQDVLTCSNPMNPSNPSTMRLGCRMQPLTTPGATWANWPGSPSISLQAGDNATANSIRLGINGPGNLLFDVDDNAGDLKSHSGAVTFASGKAWQTISGLDVSGTMTTSPSGGADAGTGTGLILTQQATVYIGGQVTFFGTTGHMTDIFINNA